MNRTAALLLALPAALAAACSSAGPAAPEPPPEAAAEPLPAAMEARAAAAAETLRAALMKELSAAMKEGGPENAVAVCGDVATRVAAEVSAREGIGVRRTSLRLRNPANAPDPWERAVLESWRDSGSPAVRGERVGGEWRWMKPIAVVAACLPCHGGEADVPAGVAEALRARYPGDGAAGFAEGDLRGAFSVSIPAAR